MKIENVYIKPDGQICACTVPVPPEPKRDRRHGQTTEFHFKIEYNKYRDALKACKDSSVRFEDQFSATILLHASLKIEPPRKAVNEELKEHVKNDTFYPLQCEVEIGPCNKFNSCPIDSGCENCKVARLIPEAKEEKPKPAMFVSQFSERFNAFSGDKITLYEAANFAWQLFEKFSLLKETPTTTSSGTAPIVEESQEELWDEIATWGVKNKPTNYGIDYAAVFQYVKDNFNLTRKP